MFKLLAFWRKIDSFYWPKMHLWKGAKKSPPPIFWTKSKRTAVFPQDTFPKKWWRDVLFLAQRKTIECVNAGTVLYREQRQRPRFSGCYPPLVICYPPGPRYPPTWCNHCEKKIQDFLWRNFFLFIRLKSSCWHILTTANVFQNIHFLCWLFCYISRR